MWSSLHDLKPKLSDLGRRVRQRRWWRCFAVAPALVVVVGAGLALGGCLSARSTAASLAEDAGFTTIWFNTELVALVGWLGPVRRGRTLTVVIEGDGRYWRRQAQPRDPTPTDPLAIPIARELAAKLNEPVLALARPCQYVTGSAFSFCQENTHLWHRARYGDAAVSATLQAIRSAMGIVGADRVRLVGFSGGGVIAALVAAALGPDTIALATLASPLDHRHWTQALGLADLRLSLDPVSSEFANRLAAIPQAHFVGRDDEVVPLAIVQHGVDTLATTNARTIAISGIDHTCCWTDPNVIDALVAAIRP